MSRLFALFSVGLVLAACAGPEPAVPVEPNATGTPTAISATAQSSATAPPEPIATALPQSSAPPANTGPSRETLCEKAFFDLERSAAAPIDKCIGLKPSSSQPITINVRVDESGHIAETKWDVSTTTGYGQKAASCILAAVKALPFEEPACSKEWLLVRRAPAQPPRRGGFDLDSRF